MKQNEKILVYAVTGFLVAILLVAIVFGKDSSYSNEQANRDPDPVRSLEDVLNDRAGADSVGRNTAASSDPGAAAASTGGMGSTAGLAVDPAADPGVDPGVDPGEAGSAGIVAGSLRSVPGPGVVATTVDAAFGAPLAAMVPLLPPTPASMVTEKLGLSRHEHGYRIVRARAGDSLGSLVQKWCGTTEDCLAIAHGLNEELTVLRIGQEVVLPWVDDEEVLAAFERRGTVSRSSSSVAVDAVGVRAPVSVGPALGASPTAADPTPTMEASIPRGTRPRDRAMNRASSHRR